MPGEAARNPEYGAGELFAAPALQELHRLGCRGVHLLASAAPPGPDWVAAPVGAHGSDCHGWRFGVRDAGGGQYAVLLEFASADQLPEGVRDELARGLRATAALAPAGLVAGPVLLVDGDAMARRLHDLRNGLNSLLMNAAVLTAKLPPEDRDGRFARQVQADGERCAMLLQAVADATRPPGGATAR